jgi:hypothetical protein
MQSKATTVDQYISELPQDRREAIQAVRRLILENLDRDYEEGMQYGMIGYYVPHRTYPPGYHCDPRQPLPFAGLASQKGYMSIYLGCVYGHDEQMKSFQQAWAKTGKKLDMGKSCLRFRKLDDLALDVIADAIRNVPAKKFIEHYESVLRSMRSAKKPAAKAAAGKAKAASRKGAKATAKKRASAGKTARS